MKVKTMPPSDTAATTNAADTATDTAKAGNVASPKGTVISKVLDLLHTAEADIAADADKLLAFLKEKIHAL